MHREPVLTGLSTGDGIYTDNVAPETLESPVTGSDGKPTTTTLAKARKNRTLLTIPSAVIHRAVGLAIFTTARAGFHVSGATGSGVIVARLPDGSWSPPSGIQVHSIGAGLMIGIDIYDCVVVINTKEALQAFTQTRMSLGSDLAIVAGPWGAGGSVDFATPASSKGKNKADAPEAQPTDAPKDADTKSSSPPVDDTKEPAETSKYPSVDEPVNGATAGTGTPERPNAGKERKTSAIKQVMKQPTYSYVKSRGFYAGVQVDGTIVTERKDANAAFYGEPVSVTSILQAEVPLVPGKENWVNAINPLLDTIKGAEGWQVQQQGQGHWANQMGPDPNSTYGHGNAPQGFPTGYDPVFANHRENTSAKTPGPDPSMAGVTQGVTTIHLDEAPGAAGPSTGSPAAGPSAAQAKAAEAAAEANMNREREERERRELEQEEDDIYGDQGIQRVATQPPGYTEVAGSGEAPQSNTNGNADAQLPPAYEDDGAPKPGVGDTKGQPPS